LASHFWTFFLSIFGKSKYFSFFESQSIPFICREVFLPLFSEIPRFPFIM
jgi:hypothetical protein